MKILLSYERQRNGEQKEEEEYDLGPLGGMGSLSTNTTAVKLGGRKPAASIFSPAARMMMRPIASTYTHYKKLHESCPRLIQFR